ncbi:nucleotide sugar dehydrogenase [Yoonia sp. R2-816]|uniref:nucleotide sugar dehydrogenase n=1 Tax=Yoonia sp. R2-816 TaxID=3342638 RepID=UPI00372876BD
MDKIVNISPDTLNSERSAILPCLSDLKVAIIGLGYVGLPLAVAFGKSRATVGFDLNVGRVQALQSGSDATGEIDGADLRAADQLVYSNEPAKIADCNVYIIAVPTPIDRHNQPNLTPLIKASETVGSVIEPGDIVIYESTVYPGATEDNCIPVVERVSGFKFNRDFYAGYSPERINPGDKERPLQKIVKVTSGSTPEVANLIDALYGTVITAGTFKAASIRVAEASKVIENIQRDVNIALINELSMIFSRIGIDTSDVLDAAASKWNFNRMNPGLVGGHCIGVDPYYLVHKAMEVGHVPDIIRMAREVNEGMPRNAITRLVKKMIQKGSTVSGGRVLLLGITFKENCPDIRNTKVVDMLEHLADYNLSVDICDPRADVHAVRSEFGLNIMTEVPEGTYDAVILAVGHREFKSMGPKAIRAKLKGNGVLFDMKAIFSAAESDLRL